jgi:hypothetical protein
VVFIEGLDFLLERPTSRTKKNQDGMEMIRSQYHEATEWVPFTILFVPQPKPDVEMQGSSWMVIDVQGLERLFSPCLFRALYPQLTKRHNTNLATFEELLSLPNIGAARATAILANRPSSGYRSVKDILRSKGCQSLDEGMFSL